MSDCVTTLPVQLFYALGFDYNPALLAVSSVVVGISILLIFEVQPVLVVGDEDRRDPDRAVDLPELPTRRRSRRAAQARMARAASAIASTMKW